MTKCDFKVIAVLKDNIGEKEKGETVLMIEKLKENFSIEEIDKDIYSHPDQTKTAYGAVFLFFLQLKEMQSNFKELCYYDYLNDETELAVGEVRA